MKTVQQIKELLTARVSDLAQFLFPAGKQIANHWCVADIGGAPGKSFRLCISGEKAGWWGDFAEPGAHSRSLIDLWMAVRKVDFKTAMREAAEWLGEPVPEKASRLTLDDAITRMERSIKMRATRRDSYNQEFVVVRFDGRDGKQFRPFSRNGRAEWIPKDPPGKLPLFRLDEIYRRPNDRVFIVEGEKCACELMTVGLLASTSAHGAKSADKTDWKPLAGRDVTILPDNDAEGSGYADKVGEILTQLSSPARVRTIQLQNLPPKGDCVDWLEARDGQTPEDIAAELLAMSANPSVAVDDDALADLLTEISTFLKRYVIFSLPGQADVIALWVAHTWALDAFDYTPYLHPFSPEKQCGKSLLLDCLSVITSNPWHTISPSEAVLFREIDREQPTLLLDEVDALFTNGKDDRKEPLRALLNAGFERKARVPRCVGQGNSFIVQHFKVFCAKVFAGIGSLPDTISDRCIPIRLTRKSRDERVERFRRRDAETLAAPIARRLEAWVKGAGTIDILRAARPTIPDELSDRQADICEPLLAIADLAGGEWPARSRSALVKLCASENEDESLGVKVLSAIREAFESEAADRISTATLLEKLVDQETDAPWATWWEEKLKNGNTKGPGAFLARLLKPFGIKARVIRLPDESTPRGYMREDFKEAWKRYCPSGVKKDATMQHTVELHL
jgi:hypothetical protein